MMQQILLCILWWIASLCDNPHKYHRVECSVTYKNVTMCFSTSMGQAVSQYELLYRPPGYYYRYLPDSTRLEVEPTYESRDLLDERQPASATASKLIDTYAFSFRDTVQGFERELVFLESLIHKKLVLSQKMHNLAQLTEKTKSNNFPNRGIIKIAEAWTNDSVHVVLREIPRFKLTQEARLEVLFFKNKNTEQEGYRILSF
jgi:hypothetical protein